MIYQPLAILTNSMDGNFENFMYSTFKCWLLCFQMAKKVNIMIIKMNTKYILAFILAILWLIMKPHWLNIKFDIWAEIW